jgi:hypothetical protein
MPPGPGAFEVRYILNDGQEILAAAALEVSPADATLIAPDAATAGATIVVDWTGPDYDRNTSPSPHPTPPAAPTSTTPTPATVPRSNWSCHRSLAPTSSATS